MDIVPIIPCPKRTAFALLVAAILPIHAQDSAMISFARRTHTVLLGSPDEDRLRLKQIRTGKNLAGSLIRSASAFNMSADTTPATGLQWSILDPVIDATWNSQIPFSMNDGALWAGRGINTRLTVGARANLGPLHV